MLVQYSSFQFPNSEKCLSHALKSSSSEPRKIRKLQQLHKFLPPPGFGYGDTEDSLVDITDPNIIKYFIADRFDGSVKATSNSETSKDIRVPFPNSMTNFWRWRDDYSICLSLGVIWVLNWTEMRWSVVTIHDSQGSELSFPDDMLVSVKGDADSMRLIRFWPNREGCTHVVTRNFTFSLINQSKGRIPRSRIQVENSSASSSNSSDNSTRSSTQKEAEDTRLGMFPRNYSMECGKLVKLWMHRPPPRCAFDIDRDLLFDFTNPSEILHLLRGEVVERTSVSQGDPIYGYPNPQTMSNFVNWRENLLCLSDGLIWEIDFVGMDNSNNAFNLEGDKLGLARFLPSRESCDSVTCHFFTLSTQPPNVNPQPAPISADVLSESNNDTQNEDKNSESYSCKICLSSDNTIRRSAIIPCGHVACVDCIGKNTQISQRLSLLQGKSGWTTSINPPCFWNSPDGRDTIDFTDRCNIFHRTQTLTILTPNIQCHLVHRIRMFPNPQR
ncbi:hypothetical protein PRIPAC_74777 [Pristionchus pacificus]|uniref:Uncharacterized protein n=1 Tax=Pristionchus pacificus TaxID=54126 RepID=A0A2A6B4M9_PRIPA|nr:hypothetical protein PRIPAC_74777 [Pristionchus pacificus]|eukprot:PDM60813.1 hypothetical protein PRIPAC_54619 [Pristionchus pacificus]